jgi:hypothetical protein
MYLEDNYKFANVGLFIFRNYREFIDYIASLNFSNTKKMILNENE